jgi:periplasmic protein TonB
MTMAYPAARGGDARLHRIVRIAGKPNMNCQRSIRAAALAAVALTAGCAAFTSAPPPDAGQPAASVAPALTLEGYKKQAARHIVAASPEAFDGKLPEILKSVVVLDLTIDRDGKVVKATVRRSNGYKDLEATALESMRRAGRLPAPSVAVHRGAPTITYLETWLFRADGRFQIRSLAEPQPVAAALTSQ